MPIPLIAAIAAPIAGNIIGKIAGASDADEAQKFQRLALAQYEQIGVPPIEAQRLIMQQLKSAGHLTPELEQTLTLGNSAMESVSTDPRLKQSQLAALNQLQGIATEGGMNAEDKQRLFQIQNELSRDEQAKRSAVQQNMQSRGIGGSGFELAAQLAGQQGSADRAASMGMDVNAMASRRALEAMMQSGQLAGNIRTQDFGEQSQVAQAKDAISKFNVANGQDVRGRNADRNNSSAQWNLTNDQRIADANVNSANQAEVHNKGLSQTNFENQLALANGKSGQLNSSAQSASDRSRATQNMWGQIGTGVAQAGAAYGQNQIDEERLAKYGKTKV
jgi:hypothetical protein